jgi:hypothetical protein
MQERSPSPSTLQTTHLLATNFPGRRPLAATLAASPAARLEAVLGDLGKRTHPRLDMDASGTQSMTVGGATSTADIRGPGGTTGIMPGGVTSNVYVPGASGAESPSGSRAHSPGGSHISGVASATAGGPVSVGLAYGVAAPASTAVSEMEAGDIDVDETRQDMQVQYHASFVLFCFETSWAGYKREHLLRLA